MSTNITKKLAGKVALVTGGSRGIGAAIVKRLATDVGRRGVQLPASPYRLSPRTRAARSLRGPTSPLSAMLPPTMNTGTPQSSECHHFRFHMPPAHLDRIFGNDWFSLKAEAFARFFGTPLFLVAQTIIVAIWIFVNVASVTKFDAYPFILLNLAFSLQAAYAAPLILLAQTRQADRDKAHAEADAEHREAIHQASAERQRLAAEQTTQLVELVELNTEITAVVKELSERIEALTAEMHRNICHREQMLQRRLPGSGGSPVTH
jgi:uncharacterized membrane protein